MTFRSSVVCMMIVLVCTCNAHAGLLEDTCNIVYKKLSAGPYGSLTKSNERFTYDGEHYHGCIIHLSGSANKVTDTQRPGGLFGNSLPYCPSGKLPSDLPRELLNENGWYADKGADGPDGTFYRVLKENVFCVVKGHWDGGDDSDPKYVASPRYEVDVKCANR